MIKTLPTLPNKVTPLTPKLPVMLAPPEFTTTTLEFPATLIVMFALGEVIFTLLLPLTIACALPTPVN